MSLRLRALLVLALGAALTAAAPLGGLAAAGMALAQYLHFPPRTVPAVHAPFSWAAFAALSLPVAAALALLVIALARAPGRPPSPLGRAAFPWWGWAGVALAALGWLLAWKEGLAPPGWRRQAFTVLWVGYILVMNALAYRRAGRAPLTQASAGFLVLFPASAAMWWLFEYLNQFVGNWHYVGIEAAGDWEYFVQGTLPFSTVLPALASTQAWLATFPRIQSPALRALRGPVSLAWIALVSGVVALAAMAVWPERLFALLWLAPLATLAGLQKLLAGGSYFAPLARGDWRCVVQPALAALVCGFFWELWNFGSLARWQYSIPLVQGLHVFEMPLLGYAGYLPFGVLCALVISLVASSMKPGQS